MRTDTQEDGGELHPNLHLLVSREDIDQTIEGLRRILSVQRPQNQVPRLRRFRTVDGKPYRLLPLPMADRIVEEGKRLPATYANFLIINGAILIPFYRSEKDEIARKTLQIAFPDREIIGIDCRPLIK